MSNREVMYQLILERVAQVEQVMQYETLDSLGNDDLEEMALKLAVAANYMSSLAAERVN